nr:DUF1194 domain-containing protein [Bauldia litoralis]
MGLCAASGVNGAGTADVDLALILAVDVSSSMSEYERLTQRDGYVSAFLHPDILWSIESGARGRIAVTYLEWAGPNYQHVLIPWTVIDEPGDAARFAGALAATPLAAEAGTSISSALAASGNLFATSSLKSDRWVVDVSGDGPNNVGPPVAPVRDWLVNNGVTINGLAITLPRRSEADVAESFGEGYLETYYEDCVIGGPDAFVIGVHDIAWFEVAIRRKLVREIAGLPARLMTASYRPRSHPVVDCFAVGQAPGR